MNDEMADDQEVGEPIEKYHVKRRSEDFLVGYSLVGLGLVTTVAGLFLPIVFPATILFSVAGVTMLARAYQARGLRLHVCPDALVRIQQGKREVLHWDRIREVRRAQACEFLGLPIPGAAAPLTIIGLDGRKWAFYPNIPDFYDFVEDVERQSLPPLLNAAVDALASGDRVKFGTVEVSDKGIHVRKQTLRWKYFAGTRWDEVTLLVAEEGEDRPFIRRNIALLPNYHVFIALCHRFRPR